MNVPIVVAMVALASSIVGATIGAATTYILAVRRAREDRERDDRNHAVEVRRAARSIDAELMWIRAAANSWIEEKRWTNPSVPLLSLSTEARQRYLDAMAPDLSDEAWLAITTALQAAESIRLVVGMPKDRALAVPDDVAESFIPLLAKIDRGRLCLAPYYFDSNQPARWKP
jgi:hypothetical protein